jgi:hypothetical protein
VPLRSFFDFLIIRGIWYFIIALQLTLFEEHRSYSPEYFVYEGYNGTEISSYSYLLELKEKIVSNDIS